jgi:hypothetical protein
MTVNQKQNVKDIAKLAISLFFFIALCVTAYFFG